MTSDDKNLKFYEFSHFRLEPGARRLVESRDESVISLSPKSFAMLLLLVQNEGRIVTKEMIFDHIWGERFVEENNLTVRISELRKALGENDSGHKFIETITGQGYRFSSRIRTREKKKSQHSNSGTSLDPLVVLPFINESGDPNLDYVSEGIAESIINKLSECFSQMRFTSSEERRYQHRLWEMQYNCHRPHQGIGNKTPLLVFKEQYPLHARSRML